MWPKLQLLAATAAVIGICLLATAKVTHASASSSTPLPLPLQPPTTPQNATTPTSKDNNDNLDDALSDSLEAMLNKQVEVSADQPERREVPREAEPKQLEQTTYFQQFVGVPGFLPTVPPSPKESSSTDTPTNGHGYIQFDINDELPREVVRPDRNRKSKKETVNEVLLNLFPNGFSDIFRYSGSEANTEAATDAAVTEATTTSRALVHATTAAESSASTEPTTVPPKNETYYSYQATVTKEFRRELRPGHTQIVVEKVSSAEGDPFSDGSNHISRDELLRINRAAVASPVLPSLLLRPEVEGEDNETLVAAESAPIVILGEQEAEIEDTQSIEDNQIAETRHSDQQLYERRLPPPGHSQTIESYSNQKGPAEQQEINVHIVHDESLAKIPEAPKAQSQQQQPQPQSQPQPQPVNHFQAHSEQRLPQQHETKEAPSRQFLKTFKPTVSGSADGPIPKGAFHYEVNSPPQRPIAKPPKEIAYESPFNRPAAQLSYQQEVTHQQAQPAPQSKLNTHAIASPSSAVSPTPTPNEYVNYGGPTANSLLYVTVNSHSPGSPSAAPQHEKDQPIPHLPSPHDYVSEAAAEPSQHHPHHAIPPKADPESHSQPETQLFAKPNGYTFVEVQKSVNIHNKLITEKDGRLVEMHETIYHQPPYEQNHYTPSSSGYSPKEYVSSGASEAPSAPPATSHPTNYVSLAANPINVEHVDYDSSPQEGAISHASLNIDVPHHSPGHSSTGVHHEALHSPPVEKHVQHHFMPEHPVKEIVEKHIPVPYAVPQPVPVPVHVEHYVDRPYPVETFVEQPVPYPVETIVEKIVEKQVPVEVERIVEKPVEVEKIVEKYIDRPMAIPIHVPVAIHMPMPPNHSPGFGFPSHPNAVHPWTHASVAHIPPKVLQNYYTRMLKKLLPQFIPPKAVTKTAGKTSTKAALVKPPTRPVRGDVPKVATFSLADMRFDLRPPPPPAGSPWLQGARYIYNTLPADLSVAAASAPAHMVKSYIGPVPTTSTTSEANGSEFDEFQRWRNGHSLKRSPDFGRNLHMEYGFKPPLVPSIEIDDKGMPLKQAEADAQ